MEIDEQEMQERPPSSSLILSKTCQGEDIPRRVLDFVVLSLVRHVFQPPQAVKALCVSCTVFFFFFFHTGYHIAPRWIRGVTWLAFEGRVSLDVLKTDRVSRIVKKMRLFWCPVLALFLSPLYRELKHNMGPKLYVIQIDDAQIMWPSLHIF